MSNGVNIEVRTPPQLNPATAAAIADLFVLWQNGELKNIPFAAFIASLISSDGGNQLVIGGDSKLRAAIPAPSVYVSTDAGNFLILGNDNKLFVPTPVTLTQEAGVTGTVVMDLAKKYGPTFTGNVTVDITNVAIGSYVEVWHQDTGAPTLSLSAAGTLKQYGSSVYDPAKMNVYSFVVESLSPLVIAYTLSVEL
jgi:hypothetical protein